MPLPWQIDTPTVVKLTRTWYRLCCTTQRRIGDDSFDADVADVLKTVPRFVLVFAAMVLPNSAGVFVPALTGAMTQLAGFLIAVVLAAVGLNV